MTAELAGGSAGYDDPYEDEGAEVHPVTWGELASWVEWLVAEYALDNILHPCWPLHPDLVQVLAAWRDARLAAGPAGGFAVSTWHDLMERQRPILTRSLGACTRAQHEPRFARSWLSRLSDEVRSGDPVRLAGPGVDQYVEVCVMRTCTPLIGTVTGTTKVRPVKAVSTSPPVVA